jgi:hypothetical protein
MRSPFRAHESTVQILGEPTTSEPLNPEPVNGYNIDNIHPMLISVQETTDILIKY